MCSDSVSEVSKFFHTLLTLAVGKGMLYLVLGVLCMFTQILTFIWLKNGQAMGISVFTVTCIALATLGFTAFKPSRMQDHPSV
jgi:hypothetical protein